MYRNSIHHVFKDVFNQFISRVRLNRTLILNYNVVEPPAVHRLPPWQATATETEIKTDTVTETVTETQTVTETVTGPDTKTTTVQTETKTETEPHETSTTETEYQTETTPAFIASEEVMGQLLRQDSKACKCCPWDSSLLQVHRTRFLFIAN